MSSFLNIRAADIQTTYETWSERGAHILAPPIDGGQETCCYPRDRDGHMIEVGQSNQAHRSALGPRGHAGHPDDPLGSAAVAKLGT